MANSQIEFQSFPEAYRTINDTTFRGNYLNMVVNENLRSERLDYLFARQWKETGQSGHFPLMELVIRREMNSPAILEFIRQDHVSFWNHKLANGTHLPLPAILITDTGNSINLIINYLEPQ